MLAHRTLDLVASVKYTHYPKANSAEPKEVFPGHIADQEGNDVFHGRKDNRRALNAWIGEAEKSPTLSNYLIQSVI